MSVVIIFLSTFTFLVGLYFEEIDYEDEDSNNSTSSNSSESKYGSPFSEIKQVLSILDAIAISFFTAEYFLRLFACPNRQENFMCII